MSMTRVYLVPGLFGFTQLAGFDYMKHLEAAVLERFRARAMEAAVAVVDVHPLASIRRRAARLVDLIDATAREGDGPIHLLGHSVGGLDARLAASPTAQFPRDEGERRQWLDRLCSVTSLNSPHYGSPGGAFFATSQGQRVLYAVSAITVSGLRLGSPPLAVTSALVAALSRSRERSGFELRLIDRIIEGLRRALDDASRSEVEDWLRQIREDQGAIAQLTPEAMDLFQAGVEDKPGLRYQCVATYAPARRPRRILRDIRKPWLPLSGALFRLLYRVAAVPNPRYSFAPPDGGDAALRSLLGEVPPHEANDGIVPLRSQLWGELVWAGQGDHLDVVGHFDGPPHHGDWLNSGSRFGRAQFDSMMDRVVEGMWAGEAGRTGSR
jgi:pimeloyl-ACP methyl ester carboxylesterase